MTRIVIVTSSFPLHPEDANSPFVGAIARAWLDLGCHVDVVVPSHPEQGYQWRLPNLHIHAVDYGRPRSRQALAMSGGGMAANLFSFKAWSQMPALFSRMLQKARALAPGASLIHACWLGPSLVAQLAASRVSVPWGVSMLGSDVDRLLAAPLNWFWRRHLRGAAFINSTSHYMVHQAEKALRVPVAHLPLEIDLERFRPRDRKEARANLEDFPEKGLVAFALGRWIPIKGMDFLIRLWPEVVARVPGVRLVLAGHGPEEEEYRNLIRALHMEDFIELKTFSRQEIPLVMAAADVVLVPSRREGLGIVAMEAMASGRAVLASDVGGLREVLGRSFDAQLLPSSDQGAWVEAIVKLAAESQARDELEQGLRLRAERLFGPSMTRQALQSLLPDGDR